MKGVLILHEFHPLNSNGFMISTFGVILAIALIVLWILIIHNRDKKDYVIGFGVIGIFAAFIITIWLQLAGIILLLVKPTIKFTVMKQ